jgi:SAM-dependent methyltransferase
MSETYTYKEYAASRPLYQRYSRYQERYAEQMRDSDRVLVEMAGEAVGQVGQEARLLDVGCSTGNLLLHIRRAWPLLSLHGGDLMAQVVDECQANPALAGMRFSTMNIFDIPFKRPFEIIVVNAVLYLFDNEQFDRAVASLAQALTPGGYLLVFDFFHGFNHDLAITERSRSHPEGLTIHMRPMELASDILNRHGFTSADFRPFAITVDLPLGLTYGDNADGFEDLNTYTVNADDGRRLLFRGALHQPWCHLMARKAAA